MKSTKNRNLISTMLLFLSLFIFIYGLHFSESAVIKKNLKDFDKVEGFSSEDIEQKFLDKTFSKKYYSFTIKDKTDIKNFRELGKVYMLDKDGKKFSNFLLFKKDDTYVIYMRNVYMNLD